MNRLKKYFDPAALALLCCVMTLSFDSCLKYPDNPYNPNARPIARLSNIPPPQDTILSKNPRLTLSWVGDDPDGYVVGFRYRWTINSLRNPNDYHSYSTILNIIVQGFALMTDADAGRNPASVPLVYRFFATLPPEGLDLVSVGVLTRGDSLIVAGYHVWASNADSERVPNTNPIQRQPRHFPVHVNPNSGTFIFDSPDSINLHTFEVSAIDNLGALSTVPAKISFETPEVQPPDTQILSAEPGPTDTALVLMFPTATFSGIHVNFVGVDPNSRSIDYQWTVDADMRPPDQVKWTDFSSSQDAYFGAAAFYDSFATDHTFFVRARNEFGSVDPTPATYTFHTLYPAFARPGYQQRILFIQNAFDSAGTAPWQPTRPQLTAFYTGILGDLGLGAKIDTWDVGKDPPDGTGFPLVTDLQKYSLVIFSADRTNSFDVLNPQFGVGRENRVKDYCFVGGKFICEGWAMRSNNNKAPNTVFDPAVLHIQQEGAGLVDNNYDCYAPTALLGYPNMVWDTTKFDPGWGGALHGQWIMHPSGFGEILYRFDSKANSALFENQPFGVRYLGVTFDCIFLGFPLYYAERPTVEAFFTKALTEFGELNRP